MAERKKIGFGTILMVILAVCVVAYVVSTMRTAGDIPYSELRQYILEEKVQEFSISDTRITAKLKGGQHRYLRPVRLRPVLSGSQRAGAKAV